MHRVEERVVDTAVDDVDLAFTGGGAHVDGVVTAEQIAALDQFHAHLASQQRVLEVGGVVDARGEHDDGRVGDVAGGGVAQGPQQMGGVVADRPHPVGGEQVREHPRHGPAVLHDVGHPRRGAQVVLEHAEVALLVADQVDAGDVDAHPVGRGDAGRLAVEVLAGGHQPARDDAVAQDLLFAVDVLEVHLQGLNALFDALLQPRPLSRRDHTRHQVQRQRAFLPGQREGDALVDEGPVERVGAGLQFGGVRRGEFGVDALVGGPARCPARRTSRRTPARSCRPGRNRRTPLDDLCVWTWFGTGTRRVGFAGSPFTCCPNLGVSAGRRPRFELWRAALVT